MADRKVNGGSRKTVTRTVKQYNSMPIPPEDLKELVRIGKSYRALKNIAFDRYGGVTGLPKLYGRNAIEKELLAAGIREELSLPSIYFQMAIKEASANMQKEWTLTKRRIRNLAERNRNFTADDVHYIHFILKVDQAFMAVCLRKEPVLPESHREAYGGLAAKVDGKRLDNYIRNKVRKYHKRLKAVKQDTFSVDRRGYSYRGHSIELASGRARKRISIPLTDGRAFDRQLKIRLIPGEQGIEIYAPIGVRVREHGGYIDKVGIALGMDPMLTTDKGRVYGAELKRYQDACESLMIDRDERPKDSMRAGARDIPGGKKYLAKKKRSEEQLRSYIGKELNRFLRDEEPAAVYLPKHPPMAGAGRGDSPKWKRARETGIYILEHLGQKCEERGCAVVRVPGRGIGTTCSDCGSLKGKIEGGAFICGACGYKEKVQINSARNALKRGQDQGSL